MTNPIEVTPRFELGDDPASVIYLHFLNRELLRALNVRLSPQDALAAIDTLAVGSSCRFVSTIAFLWESCVIFGGTSRRMAALMRLGDLQVISEYATPDEFIAACQRLYAFDRRRYGIYFTPPPEGRLFRPTVVKDESTTEFLELELSRLGREHVVPEITPIVHADKVAVVAMADIIADAVDRREARAVTISLFRHIGSRAPESLLAVARLLSGLHLAHYLRFTSATIATGLPRLSYFEPFARGFPRHDVQAIGEVLQCVGLHAEARLALCNRLEAWRHGEEHSLVARTMQRLVCGLFYRPDNLDKTATRGEFTDALRHLSGRASTAKWAQSDPVTLACAADRLAFLTRMAARQVHFGEFVEKYGGTMEREANRLLILTTTNVELDQLIHAFSVRGQRYNRDFAREHTLYHFGIYRGVEVIAIQSEMGTESPAAMTLTAVDVVDAVRPDFMVLVGIGFGLKPKKQRIGDVMVSRQLRLFDPRKIAMRGRQEYTIPRGDRASSAPLLLDRCRGARTEWKTAAVHFGPMWTGNAMVNSPSFVAKLRDLDPDAIGGEMEGAGVYCVGAKRKVDWIVIKAIADWGMGKTDRDQALAAANAMSFLMLTLDQGGLTAPTRANSYRAV